MKKTSPNAPVRAVSDEEITSYQRDGAVLLKSILPLNWVTLVRDGLEEIHCRPGDMTSRATGPDGRGEITIDQYASHRNEKLRQFVRESSAAAIAGELLRSSTIRFVIDQTFYKPAGRVLPTPWHQDTPYLRVSGNDLVRLWVTCDPSPSTTTVSVVRGSHLWNVVYRPVTSATEVRETQGGTRFAYGTGSDYDSRLPQIPDIEAHRDSFDILSWNVEPGDVLAFNGNIVHGAGGMHMHPHSRRAFATLWAGNGVRYCKRPGRTLPDQAELVGASIADGTLLSERPDVFPSVWQAASGGGKEVY